MSAPHFKKNRANGTLSIQILPLTPSTPQNATTRARAAAVKNIKNAAGKRYLFKALNAKRPFSTLTL